MSVILGFLSETPTTCLALVTCHCCTVDEGSAKHLTFSQPTDLGLGSHLCKPTTLPVKGPARLWLLTVRLPALLPMNLYSVLALEREMF